MPSINEKDRANTRKKVDKRDVLHIVYYVASTER